MAVVGLAYVGYLALLVTCDLRRVAPLGFIPLFEPGRVVVGQLQPDSIGARAGLHAGDRLTRANGQVLEGSGDWERVRVHFDPSKPLDLEIEHAGEASAVTLMLTAGLQEWRTGPPRPALLAFRLAQIITLGFALVVAFKRNNDGPALFGAVLLGSLATVSLPLPMRLVAFWHALPSVPAGAAVDPVRDKRCRRPVAVCLLRGVSAPHVVAAQARRRDLPRGADRRLARLRLASHHPDPRAADRPRGLVDGRVRHQRALRRRCRSLPGGAQAGRSTR